MKKIGIFFASDAELAPFLPYLGAPLISETAMLTVYESTFADLDVCALYGGVGKVNAAVAAQVLIDRYGAEAIICAGVAGGVDPSCDLFDTVVSTETAYHDLTEDILTEFHPWMNSVWFEANTVLLDAARRTAADGRMDTPVRFGRMVTGECFVEDDTRETIWKRFAPLSADMESAALHHVCYVNRTPFLAVRTITDNAAHSGHDNFEQNCECASEIAAQFTAALLRELSHRESDETV